MARNCIFYSEGSDMGATIPFCVFDRSSKWNCCKYFELKGSTQELCPHYISISEAREALRKSFIEEAGANRRMTRREKLQASLTDNDLWYYSCMRTRTCGKCPVLIICKSEEREEEFKAWLDEEVEDDGSV